MTKGKSAYTSRIFLTCEKPILPNVIIASSSAHLLISDMFITSFINHNFVLT